MPAEPSAKGYKSGKAKFNQPTIKASFLKSTPYEFSDLKQICFDFGMTTFICEDNLPFNIAEGRGFRSLMNMVDPKMTLKTSTTYFRWKLSLLYHMVQDAIQQDLKKSFKRLDGIAFTTDMRTSRSNDAYVSHNTFQ